MNSKIATISALALSAALAAPSATRAQEDSPMPLPPQEISAPLPITATETPSIGDRVRTNFEERVNNIRTNREYRNSIVQERTRGSEYEQDQDAGSPDAFSDEQDGDGRPDIASTSSSMSVMTAAPLPPRKEDRPAERKMRRAPTDPLAGSLLVAFENLSQIRDRISKSIDSAETSGADVSEAKNDLSDADAKLAFAKTAIGTYAESVATSTSTSIASSSPATATNGLGAAAKSTLRDARDALALAIKALISAEQTN